MSLAGKKVLVTGASSGIGAATAVAIAAQGGHVALFGRRATGLERTAQEARGAGAAEVLVVPVDLTRPPEVDEAATVVLDRFGGLDGLVNNAGVGLFAPISDAELKDLQYMFDLHVRGPVQLVQRCLPSLRARNGSIVNVTSVSGDLAAPRRSFYGATKAAINHLTRSLAIELAPAVRVNGVAPGPVDTPAYDGLAMTGEERRRFREELTARTPIGRFGRSAEVATWVCHLLDDSAAWVTGALIRVDGGRGA